MAEAADALVKIRFKAGSYYHSLAVAHNSVVFNAAYGDRLAGLDKQKTTAYYVTTRDSIATILKKLTTEYMVPRKANFEKSRCAKLQVLRKK